MRRSVRAYLIAGFSLILAAAAGFGLPWLLLRFEDGRQTGRVEQEEVSRLEISEQPVLTIVQKVRLMQRDSTNSMILEKGRNYSQETILDKVDEELNTLVDAGIPGLPLEAERIENEAFFMEPVFLMDVEGENSFIVWQGQLYMESGVFLGLYLDDETGKILSLSCHGVSDTDIGSAEETVNIFGEYLGCRVATMSSEAAELAHMSEEMRTLYEKEVQSRIDSGSLQNEAQDQVDEEWGLPELGYTAEARYRDESGLEMQYRISFSTEDGNFLILPQ